MNKRYLPSHKRADEAPPMRVTARDLKVLDSVHRFRLLSAPQIEALHFPSPIPRGCRTSCQRRLQLQFHHDLLTRVFQPIKLGEGRAPIVYALGPKGADLLASRSGVDRASFEWNPKTSQVGYDALSHRLAINQFRVAFQLICQSPGFVLMEWIDDGSFRTPAWQDKVPARKNKGRLVRNYPDGYFALGIHGRKAHFFLEVDMGTMTHKRWQDKIEAYLAFRDSGLAEAHYGTRNFRLLTLTSSQRRCDGLVRSSEAVGAGSHFWFATIDQVDIWQPHSLLAPIWAVARQSERMALFPQLPQTS